MSTHKFEVGDLVLVTAGKELQVAKGAFIVTRRMPAEERGCPRYRVRSQGEDFERLVDELDLRPLADESKRRPQAQALSLSA